MFKDILLSVAIDFRYKKRPKKGGISEGSMFHKFPLIMNTRRHDNVGSVGSRHFCEQ